MDKTIKEGIILPEDKKGYNLFDINKYIESTIENKINSLLQTLPDNNIEANKPIYNFTVLELYKNTIQTIIDIINELTELYNNNQNVDRMKIYEIMFNNDRKIYMGIVFVVLSFIFYFIDGLYI
jgi:hypothetical protein